MTRIAHLLSEDALADLERVKYDALIAEYASKGVHILPAEAKRLAAKGFKVKRPTGR